MKKLGRVVSLSDDKLVLKTEELIKIGAKVFDEEGKFVGNVIDYFGPTVGPYVLVSTKREPSQYVGKELFG